MMKRCYKREELLALRETGKDDLHAQPWAEKIVSALEFFADEFYEMENGHIKSRHRNADRRQRGSKAKSWDRGLDQALEEEFREGGVVTGWSQNNKGAVVVEEAEVDEEEEDSDDDIDSFQPRAFAVEGEPDFASGPPQDGWEYLRRVRWEAAQCPKVKVAKIDPQKLMVEQTPYMPSIPTVQPCASHLLPSKGWETEFLVDFSNLRTAFSCISPEKGNYVGPLPSIHNEAALEVFCFGRVTTLPEDDSLTSTGNESEDNSNSEIGFEDHVETEGAAEDFPLDFSDVQAGTNASGPGTTDGGVPKPVDKELSSRMEMSGYEGKVEQQTEISECPKGMIQTSQDIVDGLKIGGMSGESKDPKPPLLGILMRLDAVSRAALLRFHITWLERVDGLPYERTLWLFALSVVVDKPLDAHTSAAFRALLRRCAILRATKMSADDEELHRLNLLITIAGHYFGQSEDLLG